MNDQIRKEISTKYKNINDVDLSDITRYICTLPEQKARKVWIAIKEGFTDNFPTLAKVRQFIGNQEDLQEPENIIDLSTFAMRCNVCEMVYANKRDRISGIIYCPRCGSSNMNLIDGYSDDNITFAQDHCYRCVLYRKDNQRGIYGPMCKEYGVKQDEPECRDCACKGCCSDHKIKYEIPKISYEERLKEQKKKDWRAVLDKNIKHSDHWKSVDYLSIINFKGDKNG